MKLVTVDFDIDRLEFVDRYGMIRESFGCSLAGVDEFKARWNAIVDILEEGVAIASFYRKNKIFRHHCDCCLRLNGIDPDWLDAKGVILTGLLFEYEGNAGLLVRLNIGEVPSDRPAQPDEKPTSIYEVGGALLAATNNLQQVLDELNNLPAKPVTRILEARAKLVADADPEQREKRKREEWAKDMRKKGPQRINLAELKKRQAAGVQ